MKGEHRKELETNVLADRMGKLLTSVKQRPRGRSVLLWLLAVAAVVAVLVVMYFRNVKVTRNSEHWVTIDLSQGKFVEALLTQFPDSNPGRAARYQMAWVQLWDRGLKYLGALPAAALKNIRDAKEEFEKLAEECKDDPVLAPQALYCAAAAEEAQTFTDRAHLERALKMYKDLAERYPDSAQGKEAAARAKFLEVPENQAQVRAWYEE